MCCHSFWNKYLFWCRPQMTTVQYFRSNSLVLLSQNPWPRPHEDRDVIHHVGPLDFFQAKLAASFAPSVVKLSKIFDVDERKYREMGLHFRHTDNINYFLTAAKFVGLPLVNVFKIFYNDEQFWSCFSLHTLGLTVCKMRRLALLTDSQGLNFSRAQW